MPATTLPLSSQVDAILACNDDVLTSAVAASLTLRSASTITQACVNGEIEAHYTCSRGRGHRKSWRFSRAALLAFLWKNTSGDKHLMRAALRQRAPELLALLEPPPAEAAPALPENVILMSAAEAEAPRPPRRARRTDHTTGPQTGDLFARLTAS